MTTEDVVVAMTKLVNENYALREQLTALTRQEKPIGSDETQGKEVPDVRETVLIGQEEQ